MKKQSINRKYNFPDADLYRQSLEAVRLAKRDLEGFEDYGYDAQSLKAFMLRCEQFAKMPSDDELLGDQMVVTDKKYEAAENLKSAIRSVMVRVRNKFSQKSGRYRKFGTNKLGDMTDAQLLFCGRRVVRVARSQLDFLSETGLNEDHLGRVSEAARRFENALNIQHDRVADRDISVERRVKIGNQIYDEFIKICEIGKDIWADSDPTKYQQYCIYESNNEQKKIAKRKT
ncbi:MAG: hypothetical protein AAF741_13250 [Bacteroidota bacterium]